MATTYKLRGYILIETLNGKTYKYVNSGADYYLYGDTVSNIYQHQGDTIGKIKYDYERLQVGVLSQLPDELVIFPERSGDTTCLCRTNNFQTIGSIYGDSDISPCWRLSLIAGAVQSVSVIEERNYPAAGNYNLPVPKAK